MSHIEAIFAARGRYSFMNTWCDARSRNVVEAAEPKESEEDGAAPSYKLA